MAFSRLILTAALAVCWAGIAAAEEPAAVANPQQLGFAPDRLQRLGEVYKGYVDKGELPGAVLLVARADKIAYFQAVGFQDREKKTPMKTDAIFRLASMTKPIVSVAAMMLVEEGKLDLMAPVSKYLPEFKDLKVGVEKTDPATGKPTLVTEPQHRPMIVQDLLRHTAGLVYGQFGDHLIHQIIATRRSATAATRWPRWSPRCRRCRSPTSRARYGNTAWRSTCSGASSRWCRARSSTPSSPSASPSRWA